MDLYRYEAVDRSTVVGLQLETFPVLKETLRGYWVPRYQWLSPCTFDKLSVKNRRWVSKTSVKRYCYPSKEDALKSFEIRKSRYVEHCRRRLEMAEMVAQLIDGKVNVAKPHALCWELL
jgi:hypothetical protein